MGIGVAFRLLAGKRVDFGNPALCLACLWPPIALFERGSQLATEAFMRQCRVPIPDEETNQILTAIACGWPTLAVAVVAVSLWRLTKLLVRPLASVARLASGETMRRLRERE
jgi:hypothetical protein